MIFHAVILLRPEPWRFSIAFYQPSKKTIVDWGSSRACGCNCNKKSIHAEQNAINFCNNYTKKKDKLEIYIWRYDARGSIKSAFCCNACTMLVNKYKYNNKVFTFMGDNIVSAIVSDPQVSLAWKIKHNL